MIEYKFMRIMSYLILIFLTPTLILLNFRLLVFNHSFYKSEFTKLNVYQQFQSKDIVNHKSEQLIKYLCCGESLSSSFYTNREKLHLIDVKNLIYLVNIQFIFQLISVLIISAVLFIKKKINLILQSFKLASFITIISIILLWSISKLNFDQLFFKFHLISFKNDYWLLPKEANLIKLFPAQFFADFANRIALQTLIMATVILVISVILNRTFFKR